VPPVFLGSRFNGWNIGFHGKVKIFSLIDYFEYKLFHIFDEKGWETETFLGILHRMENIIYSTLNKTRISQTVEDIQSTLAPSSNDESTLQFLVDSPYNSTNTRPPPPTTFPPIFKSRFSLPFSLGRRFESTRKDASLDLENHDQSRREDQW